MLAFSDPIVASDARDLDISEPLLRMASSSLLITGASGMLMGYLTALVWHIRQFRGINDVQIACASRVEQPDRPTDVAWMDYRGVVAWIRETRPQIVIHGASPADPREFVSDPVDCLDANILLTRDIARACAEVGSAMLFVSSGEVYGLNPPTPTDENSFGILDQTLPRSVYSEAKRAGEAYVAAYGRKSGLDVRIVRLFHTFGPGVSLSDSRIFASLINAAIQEKPFPMRSDGTNIRSLLYAFDAMNGMAFCLDRRPRLSATNVASATGLSIRQIADLAMSVMAPNVEPGVVHVGRANENGFESEITHNVADNRRLLQTGWHPQVELSSAFLRTFQSALWKVAQET